MNYTELIVQNLGYADAEGSVVDISNLNNTDPKFHHLGYNYPDFSGAGVVWRAEAGGPLADKRVLVVHTGVLDVGEAIAAGNVLSRLRQYHGWPETAFLDGNGIPAIPK